MQQIIIVGAGLAGLSAAITLAEQGAGCALISAQPSERAQSVLAEGGINAALDTMGQQDSPAEHLADTLRGGAFLADPNAAAHLTENAPAVVQQLLRLGVPFHKTASGSLILRSFGGQKKKRTAYAQSSTGKVIMTALIDAARKYEASGRIVRYPHHECLRLLTDSGSCRGVRVRDCYTSALLDLFGTVILCSGGMNGMFPGQTTGTSQNTGDMTAAVFSQGVPLANPEMLQYHPTTVGIPGKRCLVTEAARGEGGRLYVTRNGAPWYFMEARYPELGNLMPRDVVAREMYKVRLEPDCGDQVYLDLTGLPDTVWTQKLADLRAEIIQYLELDPKAAPIPVHEGIHYFMGGIDVDLRHRTGLPGLYAAGECACQYHGANRLGGNSMLGAIFGGQCAAKDILATGDAAPEPPVPQHTEEPEPLTEPASPAMIEAVSGILLRGLGIVRNETQLCTALEELRAVPAQNAREKNRLLLAEAMLRAALERRESRGAHFRADHPQTDPQYQKTTVAAVTPQGVQITFREIPERRQDAIST